MQYTINPERTEIRHSFFFFFFFFFLLGSGVWGFWGRGLSQAMYISQPLHLMSEYVYP